MFERMSLARQALKLKMISDDVVFFDIQVARDLMPGPLQIDYERLGPVKLPYPKIFMEYEEPVLDPKEDHGLPSKIGFLIEESETSIMMKPFFCYEDGPYSAQLSIEFKLTDDGFVAAMSEKDMADAAVSFPNKSGVEALVIFDPQMTMSNEMIETMTPIVVGMARTCLTALSLINCRNVKTETLGTIRVARSGSEKRRKVPPKDVRYSTIILPGSGSKRVGSGSRAHHRASAVHRVRGHFKTYTADNPLMGKHVGTYWWGWQIRGSIDSGVVESEYVIGA